MSDVSSFLAANEPWLVLEKFGLQTPIPVYFNGVPCPHYGKYKRYERELERGTRFENGESKPLSHNAGEVREWLNTLPDDAEIGGDYDGEIYARWERELVLTEDEILLREKYLRENPIPGGEPDPMTLRWRRSVPFDAPTEALVEGAVQNVRPPWVAEAVKHERTP